MIKTQSSIGIAVSFLIVLSIFWFQTDLFRPRALNYPAGLEPITDAEIDQLLLDKINLIPQQQVQHEPPQIETWNRPAEDPVSIGLRSGDYVSVRGRYKSAIV